MWSAMAAMAAARSRSTPGERAGISAQGGTVLVSNVTAPFRAAALPDNVAPLVRVMPVRARMLPAKFDVVPIVAELPTCQKTLQLDPPFVKRTLELLAVVSVLPILKRKEAFGLPSALSVSVPVSCADVVKQ